MFIRELSIYNFRNISQARLEISNPVSLIYGPNGSGKSSVLEAIYYLALCRSFRASMATYLIQSDQPSFVLNAKITEKTSSVTTDTSVGVQRGRSDDAVISIDGTKTTHLSDLVDRICVQLIYPHSSDLIVHEPELRRNFIDWGVYYHFPQFNDMYSRYRKCIKQRNSLLKSRAPDEQIVVWDEMLAGLSVQINALRRDYLALFSPCADEITRDFFVDRSFTFELSNGYPDDDNLIDILAKNLEKDRMLGYTFYGCHRADIKIKTNGVPAGAVLSRGQLKLLICAMRLAQGVLLNSSIGRNCIYLFDDFNSELDSNSQHVLLDHLTQLNTQVFITNISNNIAFPDGLKVGLYEINNGIITSL